MRTRQSILNFLINHLIAVLVTLVLHSVLIGSTLYFKQAQSDKPLLFSEQLPIDEKASNKVKEKNSTDSINIIQAEVIDSAQLAKRVAELKAIKLAEEQAQLYRLQNIQQQRHKLSIERKKLNQQRLKEEKNLARLRKQQGKIKKQRDKLLAQEKKAAKELQEHKKATKSALTKLAGINKKQEETKKILQDLQQKNKRTKQENSKLIKKALEDQRQLKKLRAEEELKIAQASYRSSQLELEAKEKEKHLQDLAAQEKHKINAIQQRLNTLASIQKTELSKLKTQYITRIRQSVRNNWYEPPNSNSRWTCKVNVEQTPSGKIKLVKINRCSKGATRLFKESIIKAVHRSDPLPHAPDIKVFESTISFEFIP